MADNINTTIAEVPSTFGVGTIILGSDEISGVHYPKVKLVAGVSGAEISGANPLPVAATITGGGDATAANQVTGNASLSSIDTKLTLTKNTGTVDANTLRITLASNGPGVTALDSINTKTPALDNSKQPVIPSMTTGGNLSVTTATTGTNYTVFGSQALKQLTVSNQTGVAIEFQQGGSGVAFQVPNGAFYTFFGITNANQIGARRVDTSNTQVTVTARWES